jgi:hypothetical protein
MEGETGWQMRHNYNSCMKMLESYQTQIVTEWQSNITAELTMKLKQPLFYKQRGKLSTGFHGLFFALLFEISLSIVSIILSD